LVGGGGQPGAAAARACPPALLTCPQSGAGHRGQMAFARHSVSAWQLKARSIVGAPVSSVGWEASPKPRRHGPFSGCRLGIREVPLGHSLRSDFGGDGDGGRTSDPNRISSEQRAMYNFLLACLEISPNK
jgi:hypothetical protein